MSASARFELGCAAASGLLLGAAFLPLPLGFLGWFAFVPLLIALERRIASGATLRRLFGLGYVGGVVYFLTCTHWLALLSDVAITLPWLKYVAWLAAGGYLALFWGLAAAVSGWLSRRSGLAARWTFALALLLVEELRGSGEMGFPWFQPGYTQHAYVPVLCLAAWGSVTLVTGWLLMLNAAIRSLLERPGRQRWVIAVLLLVGPWLAGAFRRPIDRSGPPLRVALIQADIPGAVKWSGQHQREILDTYLALSDSAARLEPSPALIIWSETATGSYMRKQMDQTIAVAEFAARRRVAVFAGFADYAYRPDGTPQAWNAAGQWNADGSLSEVYAKRHLVPFGERVPFQRLVPALGRIDFGQAEWTPGDSTVLFPSAAGPFATLICFESIFPDLARRDVRAGARWLVNVTNDEWFGNSPALYQHAAMAPFRAAENAVPLLRCANNGLTQVIDARGSVVAEVPVFSRQILSATLPPSGGRTPYTALGDWPAAVALVLLFGVAWAPWRRSSVTRSGGSDPT